MSYRWDPVLTLWFSDWLSCDPVFWFMSPLLFHFVVSTEKLSFLFTGLGKYLSHLVERSCQCLWWSAPPWLVHLLVITSSLVPLQILGTYLISEISQYSEIQLFGLQLKKQTCKMTQCCLNLVFLSSLLRFHISASIIKAVLWTLVVLVDYFATSLMKARNP